MTGRSATREAGKVDQERFGTLTQRERECLRLVLQHKSSKQIAKLLGISHHTVDDHLRKAIRSLGTSDRQSAAIALARYEAPPQPLGDQERELPKGLYLPASDRPKDAGARPSEILHEEQAPYLLMPSEQRELPRAVVSAGRWIDELGPSSRILAGVGVLASTVIVITGLRGLLIDAGPTIVGLARPIYRLFQH